MPKAFIDGGPRQHVRTRGRIVLIDSRRVNTDANIITVYQGLGDLLIDQMEVGMVDCDSPKDYLAWLKGEIRRIEKEYKKGGSLDE